MVLDVKRMPVDADVLQHVDVLVDFTHLREGVSCQRALPERKDGSILGADDGCAFLGPGDAELAPDIIELDLRVLLQVPYHDLMSIVELDEDCNDVRIAAAPDVFDVVVEHFLLLDAEPDRLEALVVLLVFKLLLEVKELDLGLAEEDEILAVHHESGAQVGAVVEKEFLQRWVDLGSEL